MTSNPLPASLAGLTGLTGANRPIRLRLASERGVADKLLLVKHVSGAEAICGGLEYRLLCVATQAGMPLKQFNAMAAEIQFVTDKGALRSVCGIVASRHWTMQGHDEIKYSQR